MDTPLRQVQVTFDCHEPRSLSRFWCAVLGYVIPAPPGVEVAEGDDPLAAWDVFLERVGVPRSEWGSRSAIQDPTGQGPRIFFQQVPEGKVVKNRLHLDVRAAPGLSGEERMAALESECTRLVALGATRQRRIEGDAMDEGIIVMQDPEGNEFCLD
ncbi:MAG TPA: VOC family protein [Nocardioides sp.]|nr:VOC family protein [Nocardioides sp.]